MMLAEEPQTSELKVIVLGEYSLPVCCELAEEDRCLVMDCVRSMAEEKRVLGGEVGLRMGAPCIGARFTGSRLVLAHLRCDACAQDKR